MATVLLRPLLLEARPVCGLTPLAPALKVMRTESMPLMRGSVELTMSLLTTRLSSALRESGLVLVTLTACAATKVSRQRSAV